MLDRKLDDETGRGKKSPEFGEFKIQQQRLSDFRKLAEILFACFIVFLCVFLPQRLEMGLEKF